MTLLFNKPCLSRPVRQGLVLQGALATLVANRAVQRVVRQEELQHPILRLFHFLRIRNYRHLVGRFDKAGGLQRGSTTRIDFNKAHSTDAHRLHSRVITEPRNIGSGLLSRGNQHLALLGNYFTSIECD